MKGVSESENILYTVKEVASLLKTNVDYVHKLRKSGLLPFLKLFHSLRHTHATMLIDGGVSPKAVQQRLGHKNVATTLQIYVKSTENMQQEAVDAFDKIMSKHSMPHGEVI